MIGTSLEEEISPGMMKIIRSEHGTGICNSLSLRSSIEPLSVRVAGLCKQVNRKNVISAGMAVLFSKTMNHALWMDLQ